MTVIRKRVPLLHDRAIMKWVRELLFPFARKSSPGLEFQNLHVRNRLQRGVTFIAETPSGNPTGFVHVMPNANKLWIDMLAVDRNAQGKGSGTHLMNYAEAYGRRYGCSESLLFVDIENHQAQHFYENRGYAFIRFEPTANCYLLSKPLKLAGGQPRLFFSGESEPFWQ